MVVGDGDARLAAGLGVLRVDVEDRDPVAGQGVAPGGATSEGETLADHRRQPAQRKRNAGE
jgi:hypothetical protein